MGPHKYSASRHTDDFDIQALVDSQLNWEDEKKVWKAIESNPELKRRYEDLVRQKKMLLQWWAGEDGSRMKSTVAQERRETLLV